MTESDMKRLEAAIGQKLSAGVRGFFLNFPEKLRALPRDPDEDDFELTDDADRLIEMNRPGKHIYQPVDWEPRMFILGAGSCGETFWADLNTERGGVWRFDAGQEGKYSDPIADSLEEFAQGMIE